MEQVLVFHLGDEQYGLEVQRIQEVVEAATLHYIPRAPEYFLGAINFHGEVLPVFDLAAYLGFPEAARDTRVVVLTPGTCALAFAVHRIRGFVPYDEERVAPVAEDRRDDTYIRAVLSLESEMINILDLDRFLQTLEGVLGGNRGA